MLGGIAAATDASGVTDKVDEMFEAAVHMAIKPAAAATVSGTTIDKATMVPDRTISSRGQTTSDYIVKGSAYYQSNNSSGKTDWYGLSNGAKQTGLVVYNTAFDTASDFQATGAFYPAKYQADAADYNGILVSSILPDNLGSGEGGGGLGINGIKNAISFGIDMHGNGSSYGDANGTYPMIGIRQTGSDGKLKTATVDSQQGSGSGVSSVTSAPSGITSGD